MDTDERIEKMANDFLGKICWGISAGGCTGSRIQLEIGDKILRKVPLRNPNLPPILQKYQGHHGLQVGCASWRLESSNHVITSSEDDSSPDGPMVRGLAKLQNCLITGIAMWKPGLDLRICFNGEYNLLLFCNQIDPLVENYTLSIGDVYLAVGGGAVITIESPQKCGGEE